MDRPIQDLSNDAGRRERYPMIGWGNRSEWETRCEIRGTDVLWTIFVILLLLWLVGVLSAYTLGGFIHILLVLALVVMLIRIIQGRSPVV
jgi:hypothetical protein